MIKAFFSLQRRSMLPLAAPSRAMSAFANHRNTSDNNDDTPFEFT